MASENAQPKKSGLGILLVVIILIIGGGVAALHFTGRLQPILDIVMGNKEEIPLPDTAVEIVPTVERKMPEPELAEALGGVKTDTAAKSRNEFEDAVTELTQEQKLEQYYRDRFKAPEVGKPLTVVIKGNSKQSGTLTYIDENGLRLRTDKVSMTLSRNQLAPMGLARCYEDEYVKYMMAREQNRAAAVAALQERDAQLAASYAKFMASRGKAIKVTDRNTASTAKQSVQDMDFKAWMEENGQTEALKARQERIKAYERERAAEAARKRTATD